MVESSYEYSGVPKGSTMNRLAVLIVEDSEDDAILIVRLLKNASYDVLYRRVENAQQMNTALCFRNRF